MTNTITEAWEQRLVALWKSLDDLADNAFVAQLDILVGELPRNSSIGLFERGAAQDSTGHSDLAIPLYREALAGGLTGLRRRRATIQLASSLRNLGNAPEAADLLTEELRRESDELDGAVRAFLALALVDLGRRARGDLPQPHRTVPIPTALQPITGAICHGPCRPGCIVRINRVHSSRCALRRG